MCDTADTLSSPERFTDSEHAGTAFEIASDGWKTCTLTCSTDAGNIQLSYWTVAVRQYA